MDSINRFSGPVVSDLDYSDIKPNQLSYPSLNVRIYNKEGQGFIATNVKGNKHDVDNGIGFKLTDGYVGVGGVEHNGILYILSWNETSEEGEIGCFPSPAQNGNLDYVQPGIDRSLSGFIRTYSPLVNLATGSTREWFRTSKLDFGTYVQEVIVKPSYDNSVDLYICNGRTPNLVINSGFNSEGVITERLITEDQFDSTLRQILPINNILSVRLADIKENGRFQPGNYFIYVKYLDKDFNSTKYITSVGPVCINPGTGMYDSEGYQEMDWIDNTENYTNKSIQLFIDPNTLDDTFKYVKFSIIRYSAFEENGNATTEIFSIEQEYNIDTLISAGGYVEFTGNESLGVTTFSDIISQGSVYNISESHTIVNKRYFGVNWKSEVVFTKEMNDAFSTFAQKIVPQWDASSSIPDYDYLIGDYPIPYGYKNPNFVTTKLGVFDGEMYPVGIRLVLKGGTETDIYPIQSKDFLHSSILSVEQQSKGIIRMPSEEQVAAFGYDINYILKMKFGTSEALIYKDANPTLFENVIGFYFVRGEKIDNLLTQGVMFHTSNGIEFPGDDIYFDGAGGTNSEDSKYIPLHGYWDDISGMSKRNIPSAISNENGVAYIQNETALFSEKYFAVYSMEKMFSNFKITEDIDLYLKPIYQIYSNQEYEAGTSILPPTYGSVQVKANTLFPPFIPSDKYYTVKATNIEQGTTNSSSKFVSLLKDGIANTDGIGYKYAANDVTTVYNRSMLSPSYIGVYIPESIPDTDFSSVSYMIVNIYAQKNEESLLALKISQFDPAVNEYSRISQMISIDDTVDTFTLSGGDNFKQRTYFRQMRFYGYDLDADHIDVNGKRYEHGLLVGFIMSSKVNTAMRNDVDFVDSGGITQSYTYYPKYKNAGIETSQWVYLSDDEQHQIEAFQINDGYNTTINPKTALAFDTDKMVIDPHKANRAYFSNPLISGSFIDQFRQIYATSYKDFLVEDSPIIKVIEHKGRVICVTRNKIFQVYVDDRLVQSNASGDNVIANASAFLSENVNILAEYGCQHNTGMIQTENALYGWDYIRSIIWRVSLSASQTPGRYFLQAEDLTKTKFYQKAVIDLKDSTDFTDIVSNPNDDVLNGDGIVLGYNRKYDEIYFTILKRGVATRADRTLIYSELINGFTPERSLDTTQYMKLGDGLYTNKPIVLSNELTGSEYYYKEDEGDPQTFYDVIQPFKLSFIVNGNSDQQNSAMVTKIFESLQIEMPDDMLSSILYETEYQTSTYLFSTIDIADKPEYEKNRWLVPVAVQTSLEDGQYDQESELEGTWIKITLQYEPTTTPQEIYIKKVISSFTLIQ